MASKKKVMSAANKARIGYYDAICHTLRASLCLQNFPSMRVECHNKPEIELNSCKESLMTPVVLSFKKEEQVKIEPSINSVRISIRIKQLDELDRVLVDRYARFLMLRAEHFQILRRKPIDGYDISLLITNHHMEKCIETN
eukprot:UN34358